MLNVQALRRFAVPLRWSLSFMQYLVTQRERQAGRQAGEGGRERGDKEGNDYIEWAGRQSGLKSWPGRKGKEDNGFIYI